MEAARIQHAEDIIFWEGSSGAQRAINSLKSLADGGHEDVTIKWDGSPAVIFGRDENGDFIFTDKSGFGAKGYDGRAKSPGHVKQMLMNRPGAKRNPESYGKFATAMAQAWQKFEQAVPADYRGFFKGDMLYFDTPQEANGNYVFQPNVVSYTVPAHSDLGRKIGRSDMAVVVHREVDSQGNETELQNMDVFQQGDVLFMPPVVVEKPARVDTRKIAALEKMLTKFAPRMDALFDANRLAELQIKDFPGILYSYANSKVDTGFSDLGADFPQWLEGSKLSQRKKNNVMQYVHEHADAFGALWKMYNTIVHVKDDIISQFDSHGGTVQHSIGGERGGEGYVMAHPEGDIKLVPREFFTRANRAMER